ncbi:MAG: hypothetical protein ABIU11_02525 [Chitinophagaceae bacterium]
MKKILFISIAFCGIITINVKVLAQTKIQLNNLQNQVSDSLEVAYTSSNIPKGKDFSLTIATYKNKEHENIVKFTASGRIVKVGVCTGDKQLLCIRSTSNYNEGTTTGTFNLDAPAYAKKYNIFTFYAEGFPEYVWSAIVERIQMATLHTVPNKIPNK